MILYCTCALKNVYVEFKYNIVFIQPLILFPFFLIAGTRSVKVNTWCIAQMSPLSILSPQLPFYLKNTTVLNKLLFFLIFWITTANTTSANLYREVVRKWRKSSREEAEPLNFYFNLVLTLTNTIIVRDRYALFLN